MSVLGLRRPGTLAEGVVTVTSWADGHLAALDFETTSPDALIARIVTASLVVVTPGHSKTIAMEWLVAVDEPIPPEATEIHEITTEYAREHGKPLGQVLGELRSALALTWKPDAPLLAMNASYDCTVLARELQRCGQPIIQPDPDARPVIDPLVCDRGLDYRKGSRKLAALCEHYGVRLEKAHNSTADALATARLVWRMARRWPELAAMSLPELHRQQVDWHAQWAAHYEDYLRDSGKDRGAVIDRSWPVRALDAS